MLVINIWLIAGTFVSAWIAILWGPGPAIAPPPLFAPAGEYEDPTRDFITAADYWHTMYTVRTDDGYTLNLHRMPRKNARRTVFFLHGIMDTSLGWVAGGAEHSLAFAAYDDECDVWLGNFRSNPPRRHGNDVPRGDYWRYTLNEMGMEDVSAQLEYIHLTKHKELRAAGEVPAGNDAVAPYALTVVAHSLGGAAALIYLVTSRCRERRHYIDKLILLAPAGFHPIYPRIFFPFVKLLPLVTRLLDNWLGIRGAALMIFWCIPRYVFFQSFQSAITYPATRESVNRAIQFLMSEDASPWESVIQLPHYSVNDMPGISFHTGVHLIQMSQSGRFRLFDYGTPAENFRHYGSPDPMDIAMEYGRIDVPVAIVAGTRDRIVPPECVQLHFEHMQHHQFEVEYQEFQCSHLHFISCVQPEVKEYVRNRIAP